MTECKLCNIEIKGKMQDDCIEKLEIFSKLYPNVRLKVVNSAMYAAIRRKYKSLISMRWEK
jgi:hypothetical protein